MRVHVGGGSGFKPLLLYVGHPLPAAATRAPTVTDAHTRTHTHTHLPTVTMRSWGELWLNEGFASYFEYAGATAGAHDVHAVLCVARVCVCVCVRALPRTLSTPAPLRVSTLCTLCRARCAVCVSVRVHAACVA